MVDIMIDITGKFAQNYNACSRKSLISGDKPIMHTSVEYVKSEENIKNKERVIVLETRMAALLKAIENNPHPCDHYLIKQTQLCEAVLLSR